MTKQEIQDLKKFLGWRIHKGLRWCGSRASWQAWNGITEMPEAEYVDYINDFLVDFRKHYKIEPKETKKK